MHSEILGVDTFEQRCQPQGFESLWITKYDRNDHRVPKGNFLN